MVSAVILGVASAPRISAQYTNRSSVLDSAGARSSQGGFAHISAVGQPGIAVSAGSNILHQAGFLNTFLMQGSLDTDHDGLPDEVDQDNDADGLADTVELGGTAFGPATPTLVNVRDTDGDGLADGSEASAGTDPTDPASQLELVAISNSPAGVAWRARGNHQKTYVVRAGSDPGQAYGSVLFSNTVAGGSAPWYAVTSAVAEAGTTNIRFYAVEVLP
jgi:hypothetical protein